MKDIFDLNNLNDLPEDIRDGLKLPGQTTYDKILSLFREKTTLSISEIQVGYYRKYKFSFKRGNLCTYLCHLKKRKILKREAKGIYKLLQEDIKKYKQGKTI